MHTGKFSTWAKWESRAQLENLHLPGIYALAISETTIEDEPFSYLEDSKYFGMTNSLAGLRGLLKQFDNTIYGKSGHGGADRFCSDYPKPELLLPKLFVAILPFQCNVSTFAPSDLLVMGKVAMAEYECFAHYASIFKRLPQYNDKASPKQGRSK
jgi:hypothetical protein